VRGKYKQKDQTKIRKCQLDKGPFEIENTLGHGSEMLESLAGEIELTMAAVTMRAGIDNTDNDALARVTLGSDTELLSTLGSLAPHLAHLSLVQGNNHVVLGELLAAGTRVITEPGATTTEGLAGMVVAVTVILDGGPGNGFGGDGLGRLSKDQVLGELI